MSENYDVQMTRKNFLPYRLGYLTDWMVQKAKEELNETEENRRSALEELRGLIAKDRYLKVWTDDAYLLQFLRVNKFNARRAWEQLLNFYVIKRDFPEVYPLNLDIENLKYVSETNAGGCYPYRNEDGSVVLFLKIELWDPNQVPIEKSISSLTGLVLASVEEPATQVCGIQVIVDAKNASLKHIRAITPKYLKLISLALLRSLPVRFKGIHVVNESVLFYYLYNLFKIFIPEKIRKRFHFHGSYMKNLHNYISKEILPPEYDGDNVNYDASDWCEKNIYSYFDRFEEMHRKGYW